MELEARAVAVGFSGMPILQEVNLTVRSGEMVGLIGPNGSGKPRCCAPWRICARRWPVMSATTVGRPLNLAFVNWRGASPISLRAAAHIGRCARTAWSRWGVCRTAGHSAD